MLGVINGKIRSSHAPHGAKAVSAHVSRGHKLAASSGASPNGLGAGPQGGVPSLSVGVNWPSQYQYYFTGILPAEPIINDPSSLALFWRDIYLHDAVGGTMVDLQMEFPFSDFILQGVKDKKILQTYIDGVAQLNMREMFPIISWAHLVDGYFCGTLIYDPKTRRFADTMVHDALQTSVRTTPFFNRDPAITVSVSNAVAQFLSTNSDYNREYIESLPEHFQSMLEEGRYDLNPVTTLFVPRRSLTDRSYESYFRRLLPMYLIEKTLYRGTLVEAQRRQRAMTHLTVGTQDWTPNPAELLNTVQNFQAAEADPLGGWIATREGVTANDLRPGGDFWRWMDTADALVPYKLRALGASESFLGGDACLAGHTLIPTTMGLRRIDSMGVGRTRNDSQPLNITVDSRLGKAKTKSWLYNGYRETFAIHTEMGNVVQATNNHPLYIKRGQSWSWVNVEDLKQGDIAKLSLNRVVNETDTEVPKTLNQALTAGYRQQLEYLRSISLPDYVWACESQEEVTMIMAILNSHGIPAYNRLGDDLVVVMDLDKYKPYLDTGDATHLDPTIDYKLVAVSHVTPAGYADVFDISMVGDPSFVANGLVVHNTFDNQATSYSMFLEGMSAYRQKLTTRIFYHRVFPMIAIINGFYKDKTHRNKSLSDYFYNATDRENLVTPSVHWKKNLDVVDDTGTFDMLERASEHGVPVTLRRYIVAAGMDPESIISEMEQDADLRRRVEEITGKSSTHESLEEDDDYGLEASTWFKSRNGNAPRMPTMSASQLKQHKVPLLARDFGNSAEPHNISRTGKKKAVPSMLHAERRQRENSQIVKVAQAMRDPNFRREMALRNQKRFGTSKHDLGSKM